MIGKLSLAWQLGQHLGFDWLLFRLGYAARLRAGVLRRRLPCRDWPAYPLAELLREPTLAEPAAYAAYRRQQAPRFFFSCSDRARFRPFYPAWDQDGLTPVHLAEEIGRGTWRYFSNPKTTVSTSFPPDWFANPFTGQRIPADRHWSQVDEFACGDIKVIWEPGRFGFTYALVRAYWRTGNEQYPELFWRLVEDWRVNNPPHRGPHWKCGQEISFRVLAWCFGLYGLLDSPATTPARVAALAQMMALSGRRIAGNLSYALNQRNNHGISEAVGLWTIGLLFPELAEAGRWQETGRRALEAQARELIYDDGAFAQHSVNYHRLMLHDYLWALRLGDLHDRPLSPEVRERVGRAGSFLYQLQDERSGRAPNYGANDGALILPLNNCDYRDFRPVVQAVHYLVAGQRCYSAGAWDEDLLWLFGPEALEAPVTEPARRDLQADQGGYYTQRSPAGLAFIRCVSFRHRPGQADMLHLDLWWLGQNIALDPGSYSYNAPAPWDGALAGTAYHNTVTVDNLDQMNRAGKFLWLPWLAGRVRCSGQSVAGRLAYWEGEHDGYHRLSRPVSYRRGVLRLDQAHWLVLDWLYSPGSHSYRLHWLLPDLPYTWDETMGRLHLQARPGPYYIQTTVLSGGTGAPTLVRADAAGPRGWQAPYYQDRQPALSLALVAQAESILFGTLFGPEPGSITFNEASLQIESGLWQAHIDLSTLHPESPVLVRQAVLSGAITDRLDIHPCTFS